MISRIIIAIFLTTSVAVAQKSIPSTVRLRVSDDTGSPVANVAIDGCFLDYSQSGALDRFTGFTDTNGLFIAKGKTVIGVYARFTRNGYYPTTIKETIKYARKADGKGYQKIREWDRDIPVLLKAIKNPIPMYSRRVDNYSIRNQTANKSSRFVTNSMVGYDLLKDSMVAPYDQGEVADLELIWEMRIHSEDSYNLPVDYSTIFEIRMTNGLDGICKGSPDGTENSQRGSAFISDYMSPLEGYSSSLTLYRNVQNNKADTNDDRHYLYYFRIRTQTNELGQITNALYGKIYGQINGNFQYFLNPTPNDRNIEEDPEKNLFDMPKE